MRWEALREEEFEEAIEKSKGLCVIPLGCLEKHGQHLPSGTDYYRAYKFAVEAAEIEPAVVFPTGPWIGDVTGSHSNIHPENKRARSFVGIDTKTMLRLLEELCDEIARNGFDKILLFHSHGGNMSILNTFIREQTRKEKPYMTLQGWANNNAMNQPEPFLKAVTERPEDFPMITDTDIAVMKSWLPVGYQGGHANFIETAEVMGQAPELVAKDRYYAEDGINNHRTDYLTKLGINIRGDWSSRYPNSYSGAAPHGCSESIGQAMIKISVERAVRVYRMVKSSSVY